jgi:DNA-directed RNA polymerase specialized sigma24 family protein
MAVTTDVLASARKSRESALGALLEAYWAVVTRLALGLCGDPARAHRVVDRVMTQALRNLPKWRDETAADRWFYHHTVLESRAGPEHPASADALLPAGQVQLTEYVAFVKALRGLPRQQQEAIVLNHGEHLNPRYLAVAMDCSTEAAANHLRIATVQLQAMTGERSGAMLEEMARVYHTLAPAAETVRPQVRQRVRRFLLPRRVRRWIMWIIVAAAVWAVWHFRYWLGWRI